MNILRSKYDQNPLQTDYIEHYKLIFRRIIVSVLHKDFIKKTLHWILTTQRLFKVSYHFSREMEKNIGDNIEI